MLGKHFTVSTLTGTKPTRHYTICNAMRPEVYAALLRELNNEETSPHHNQGYLDNLLSPVDTNTMMFVIKNYNQPTGLSEKFYKDDEIQFEVKGPMGKSLNVQPAGLHVAFAGGTGILPFIDLVAHVAFVNTGYHQLLGSKEETYLSNDFKLRLYVSNQTRQSAIGIELLEALDRYCKRHALTNFELVMRVSNEGNPRRWDASYIEEQFAAM